MSGTSFFAVLTVLLFTTVNAAAQQWQPLGGGLEAAPRELLVNPVTNELYALGGFKYVGDSIAANGFAWWTGVEWQSNPEIDTLCIDLCTQLYEMEYFDSAIYVTHDLDYWNHNRGIGRWDGEQFDFNFAHTAGDVHVMKAIDNKLYCLGLFDSIAGEPIHNFAFYDGTTWSDHPPPPVAGGYTDIERYQGDLYVSGNINGPTDTLSGILRWDGAQWRGLAGGLPAVGWVNDMQVYQGELYVAGHFWQEWGAAGNNIIKWNGFEWSAVGAGTDNPDSPNGQVWELLVHDGYLYAVGQFERAGGVPATYHARWDGSQWCSTGSSLSNTASELVVYNDELVIGGAFAAVDGDDLICRLAVVSESAFADSCSSTSTGLAAQETRTDVAVYPNPVQASFVVQVAGCVSIQLITINGRVALNEPCMTGEAVSVADVAPGLYLLRVQTRDGPVYQKLVLAGR